MIAHAQCDDCTLERCKAKPFYDVLGRRTGMAWTCLTCGNTWMVPESIAPKPWHRRLALWLLAPIQH